ncbi:hypothetical protein GGR52DRAFT_310823 [Hypoxylon sp. FL1284]|nr:hypothetical protein GGR52DRAFT_310823 [Hypoxylon sp. FL1284]
MASSHVPERQRGKSKVKSGCRTCKLRRVKCDEAWPVCYRCVSTGRICEGYGIWGGGGDHARRPIGINTVRSLRKFFAPTLISAVSNDEGRCLEWFTYRTAIKLPGAFHFGFWGTLVFQAVAKEPAVLHAALALSSAHKRDILRVDSSALARFPYEQQHFILQHYGQAIHHLRPHFSAPDNWSIRVALITCLIFIYTDYFQGHYKASNIHLQNGLRLLNEFHARSNTIDNYSLFKEPCCDSVDAWIIQAFARLDVQAKFLGQGSLYLNFMLDDGALKSIGPGLTFQTRNQARQYLDRLFNHIFHLNQECHDRPCLGDQQHPSDILAKQQKIRHGLDFWYRAYKISEAYMKTNAPTADVVGYLILHIYYTMALIMVDNCLWPADESRYDAHTTSFDWIIKKLKYLRDLSQSPALSEIIHYSDMSNSVGDLGALAAAYYVAIKCRVRQVRHGAVEYLNALGHHESIWNAPLIMTPATERFPTTTPRGTMAP